MKSINQGQGSTNDQGVTTNIEYIIISGILMLLMVVTALTLSSGVIEPPIQHLTHYAFIDIGNGVSTRIVDLYVIAPKRGSISSNFDLPDDVAGRPYFVTIDPQLDQVSVTRDSIIRNVTLAGIGSTLQSGGTTTGTGMNKITYRSEGFP